MLGLEALDSTFSLHRSRQDREGILVRMFDSQLGIVDLGSRLSGYFLL